MTRILTSARFLCMDVTPRSEYRVHIAYLTKELELMRNDIKTTKENLDKYFSMYNQENGQRHALENELIKVKSCKEEIRKKNVALSAEATNLRSGMEKMQQDLNKAEDRAQEYKDKFTLKSQELTELEAIRERECKQYEERIAKLERELRAQQQAYIEIATVHDEEKNKLEALMEATGCAPCPTTTGKPLFRVPSAIQYLVVDIDKTIPDRENVIVEATTSEELTPSELPRIDACAERINEVHQECMDKAEKLFYGDDDGECGITAVEEADEASLPSSPYYEGKKSKHKKHNR